MRKYWRERCAAQPGNVALIALILGMALGLGLYFLFAMFLPSQSALPRPISSRGDLTSEEKTTIEIFENAAPSVVFITTKRLQRSYFRRNATERVQGTGTGFVWDYDGHIVTNFHVLQGGNKFEVVLHDQSSFEAEYVGSYPDQDLAVLKINAPKKMLNPIPVGTTKDLKVGQKVLAIGNPFGWDQTLTTGVISALNRTIQSVNRREMEGVIQTDAAINPGNSGGPLIDSAGRIIGVNTQIYTPSGSNVGIGFAIPIDTANRVVPQLIANGKYIRPGLGIRITPNNDAFLQQNGLSGVMVFDVTRGSSAQNSGLQGVRFNRDGYLSQLGDIIVKIDNNPIQNLPDLHRILERYQVGDQVTLTFVRDEKQRQAQIRLQSLE